MIRRNPALRLLASLLLVIASLPVSIVLPPYAPLAPGRAEAKNLEWGDIRPPLTDEADTLDTDGFRHLPDFGNALHAITVAPNGDIFAAGTGAEVNTNNDGDCDDPTDGDADTFGADGDCDAVTSPVIFKSTDGGIKWRSARVAGAGAGAVVHQIAVSPGYPADDFVLVVFSDLATPASNLNGIAWSTDAGLNFPAGAQTIDGSEADPDVAEVLWTTAALSPDFNFNDGNGEIAIGGMYLAGAGSTGTITTIRLKAALDANTLVDIAETTAGAADGAVVDRTISLAYTFSQEPIALARLFVLDNGNTFGQVRGGSWPATVAGGANELLDDDANPFAATSGTVGFDDAYSFGGPFFAAAGDGGTIGGVFRNSGFAWSERTLGDPDCNAAIDWVTVAGNGSTTRLVASVSNSTVICRSTNEGSTWSDTDADGGASFCDACLMAPGVTRISNNRLNPENVYWTTSGNLGGVSKSTTTGSTWQDTGLTNQPYVVNDVVEVDPTKAFAAASVPSGSPSAGVDALFYTDTYGAAPSWGRSLRTSRTDLAFNLPPGFATHSTAFARFTAATADVVVKTTDGGMTWDTTITDPFENSPDLNETPTIGGPRSATTLYLGGNKGHVAVTTDGGNSWALLSRDFGERIDEFDFTPDPAVFFVTALDVDSTLKVWQTRDNGATFTQIGNAPWGTGDGSIDTVISGYNAADNTGHLLVMTTGATATDEVYRIAIGAAVWTDFDLDVTWRSLLGTSSGTVGDGVMNTLWSSAVPALFISFNALTGDAADFDPTDAANNEWENLLLALPLPPVTAGTMGTGMNPDGYTLQTNTGGRVMELTLTSAFLAGVTLTAPANNATVPPNVGGGGVPAIFQWNAVAGADSYELIIGLNVNLSDGTIIPAPTTTLSLSAGDFPLVLGNTYHWRVRVKEAEGAVMEGPWSETRTLNVGTPSAAGGKGLGITPGSTVLTWEGGTAQAGYWVSRIGIFGATSALLPSSGPLAAGATLYIDYETLPPDLYCYQVLPFDSGGAILERSDLECMMPNSRSGAGVPQLFTLRLNQSNTASFTWVAPGGQDAYVLLAVPLDGSADTSIPITPDKNSATHDTGGKPTCYTLLAVDEAAISSTDLVCGIPSGAASSSSLESSPPGLQDRVKSALADVKKGRSNGQQ